MSILYLLSSLNLKLSAIIVIASARAQHKAPKSSSRHKYQRVTKARGGEMAMDCCSSALPCCSGYFKIRHPHRIQVTT
ncbi:hypothetical protein EV424DRAFT_1376133 [Suillus variegatus]|nr:hypothetical protein EV424DRAFT_1376133 [Suillus variegatus]